MANRAHVARVLAAVLEGKEDGGFDMKHFINTPRPQRIGKDGLLLEAGQSPTLCGTTLCIAGFAALEAGWTFKFHEFGSRPELWRGVSYISPKGEEVDEIDFYGIAKKYLEISEDIALTLFYATFDGGYTAIKILERLLTDPDATDQSVEKVYRIGDRKWSIEHDEDPIYDENGELIEEEDE